MMKGTTILMYSAQQGHLHRVEVNHPFVGKRSNHGAETVRFGFAGTQLELCITWLISVLPCWARCWSGCKKYTSTTHTETSQTFSNTLNAYGNYNTITDVHNSQCSGQHTPQYSYHQIFRMASLHLSHILQPQCLVERVLLVSIMFACVVCMCIQCRLWWSWYIFEMRIGTWLILRCNDSKTARHIAAHFSLEQVPKSVQMDYY